MRGPLPVIFVLAAAACGGGDREPTLPPNGGAEPAASFDDPVPCDGILELRCAEGMVDGCLDRRTTVHACVLVDATAGPPCAQEIALLCPEGLIDACLLAPPAAEHHICVAK